MQRQMWQPHDLSKRQEDHQEGVPTDQELLLALRPVEVVPESALEDRGEVLLEVREDQVQESHHRENVEGCQIETREGEASLTKA